MIAIILFVFDNFHTILNWAKKGISIYYLFEMVNTSSLIAIILFVCDKFHTIHNWAKKGIYYLSETVQIAIIIPRLDFSQPSLSSHG